MEDEDGESKVMDMWSILGKQQLKDTSNGNSLKSIDAYDAIEEEKQLLQYNSITTKDSPSKNNSTGSKIVFKGFKKRILAQAQETQTNALKNVIQEQQQLLHLNASPKGGKEKRGDVKRGKITEYAQYLGLRPSSKSKCSKCQPSSNSCSTLKQNLCTCNSTMSPMPSTSESSTVPRSSYFKTTRKVYLCAACGTYFENWNLFLHMRDVHKRHICLFCLGMFGQAERLSHHLMKKHSVPEMSFTSVDDFYGAFKGSCYLVCCTCEKVFSETGNFYNHFCSPASKQDIVASICTLCRQTGSHASTCSLAVNTSKEVNSTVLPVTQSPMMLEKAVSSGNKTNPRKPMRNSRAKHVEDGVQNQQKVKRTMNKVAAPQRNENSVCDELINRDETTQGVIKDTVAETIMEVSQYVEDSCEEKDEKEVCQNNSELNSNETPSHNMPYDSIEETIMEVSQCTNNVEEDSNNINKEEDVDTMDVSDISNKLEIVSNEVVKPDTETVVESNPGEDVDIKKDEVDAAEETEEAEEAEEAEEDVIKEKTEEIATNDSNSHISESPAQSPVNRSLFSPQREMPASDLQPKEEACESEEKENVDVPNESQSSVSISTSETSDRSLIIRICTNRNSQFSVASNSDNVENNQKHEENNNADSSVTDDKQSTEGRENSNNYQVNDEDSDSDSDKLAVVDNVHEETEVENANETKTVVEDNGETSVNIESGENEIGNSIDTDVNGKEDAELKNDDESQMESAVQSQIQWNDGIVLAGDDVPCIDLNVDGTLDSIEIEDLLKRCIEAASPFCVYCNHARHIAVNGKQLGLHMLAEHKFQPQHPAIIIQLEQFVFRVKKSLDELEFQFFNLDSYSSSSGTYNVPDVRTYECFHCRFHSAVHKELYLHNRKMHQKTILICIMCKSTFYSYSELLCHLCPGIYSPNINVKYRCCLCPMANLPSAFRLMVHLRKRHHACDVCLEATGNQQRLSNHVWKHKLHHLCYRCGIAYRNKPDITKHLFWKHGTESVLCKKCLQKKWPHIYHFCIPPTAFVCEECGSSFSRAVALKVHKRLHSGDHPYGCSECSEHFISRKLLTKHENAHREPQPVTANLLDTMSQPPVIDDEISDKDKVAVPDGNATAFDTARESKEPVKKVVDVYDLPPLNLSSDSDTDPEDDKPETKEPETVEHVKPAEEAAASPIDQSKPVPTEPDADSIVEVEQNDEEKEQGAQIMDGIWDNFKTYTASLEMKDSANSFTMKESELDLDVETDVAFLRSIVLADHDYCIVWTNKEKEAQPKVNEKEEASVSACGDQEFPSKKDPLDDNVGVQATNEEDSSKKKTKSPKKKKQGGSTSSSDSSSDSDSSSCSCGTNCSCSSSSSGSSSSSSSSSDSDSSTSEGSPKKRKDRKKDKENPQEPHTGLAELENKQALPEMENGAATVSVEPVCPPQLLLQESDLETEETETDEDFYDEHPQQLANKMLAEKRSIVNQLMLLAAVAPASTESTMPLNNGLTDTETAAPSPDPVPPAVEVEQQTQQKKKVKTKKRKKGERSKQRNATPTIESIKLNIPKAFYQKNPSYPAALPSVVQTNVPSTPAENDVHVAKANVEFQQTLGATGQQAISGSGSEAENKRSSKRKRIPKRFYGDSSDDETEKQQTPKWRKVETPTFAPVPSIVKPLPPRLPYGGKGMAYRPMENPQENVVAATASATESEEAPESSSDSSDSEVEVSQQLHPTVSNPPAPERPVNLYCYCQCPYDEVSEMIACDAEDCRIEWFHFECVGIMVPPKGKWYCPDCRKKHGIVQNNEDYFD